MNTRRLTELSVLTAAALILSIVELQLPNPVPVPGAKLGLANIVTVYAVWRYRPAEAALLLAARLLLCALLSGNYLALQFSLAGGLLCLAGMLALRPVLDARHIWAASVLGAVLHNLGQLAVAAVLAGTLSIVLYLPALLVTGCAAGLFTGLCAQMLLNRLPRKRG